MPTDLAWALRGYTAAAALLVFAVGFSAGGWARSPAPDPEVARAAVVVRAAQDARAAVVPKVQAAAMADRAASAAADSLRDRVVVLDPSTLAVQVTPGAAPERVTVPPVVVARLQALEAAIVAKDARILALEQLVVADSAVIRGQAVQIELLEARQAPRCSTKCGAVLGAAATALAAVLLRGG